MAFPKCLGYADDISDITSNKINIAGTVLKEYKKFTEISGLQINAEKTEIFQLTDTYSAQNYGFSHQGTQMTITNEEKININGIHLVTDPDKTHKANFEAVRQTMDNQFAAWS